MVTVVLTWMLVVWNMLIKPSLCNDIGRSFQRLLRTEADGNIKHAVKGASQKALKIGQQGIGTNGGIGRQHSLQQKRGQQQ